MTRPGAIAFCFAALAVWLPATPLASQVDAGSCQLVESRFFERRVQGGASTVYISGPGTVSCSGGAEVRADSAVMYERTGEVHLFREVFFQDTARSVASDRAVYYDAEARVHATGNVVYTDLERGSTLSGPELEYLRPTESRPASEVIASGRPRLTLVPEREGEEPFRVDADRVRIVGGDRLTASGRVEIYRSDLDASGASAFFDGGSDYLELQGDATVSGERFDLSGERIEAKVPEGGVERVTAERNARLDGEDLRVDAAGITLFFVEQELARAVAWGERPLAVAEEFRLRADSLDARLQNERLREVVAVGRARGETGEFDPEAEATAGTGDGWSDGVPLDRDWLLGDTITGYFAETEPPDTAVADSSETVLERLLAKGRARALHQVEDEDDATAPPSLNYLSGNSIELTFSEGELDTATVEGMKRGAFLEPAPDEEQTQPEEPEEPPGEEPGR